jgi:hypothetical protein
MRTLTLIIILLLQGVYLFASVGGALNDVENYSINNSEEQTALWERDSEAALMGERVLADFKNNREERFAMNSFCSPDSVVKLARLRKLAADIISTSENNGRAGSVTQIAGVILKKLAEISFTPLTGRERELVRAAGRSVIPGDNLKDIGFSSGELPLSGYAVTSLNGVMSVSTILKLKTNCIKKRVVYSSSVKTIISKNLFDWEYADLYRLFFYVRDNSGNGKRYNLTYNSVSIRSLQSPCYSIRNKNTSIINTKILPSGASS